MKGAVAVFTCCRGAYGFGMAAATSRPVKTNAERILFCCCAASGGGLVILGVGIGFAYLLFLLTGAIV